MAPIKLDSNQLRALAEQADGRRGVPLKLVQSASEESPLPVLFVEQSDPRPEVTIEVQTERPLKTQNLIVSVPDINFHHNGRPVRGGKNPSTGKNDDFAGVFDALFWSASAIDKFVIPYYSTFVDLAKVQSGIRQAYQNDPQLVAIGHLPDSEPTQGTAALNLVGLSLDAKQKRMELQPLNLL